MKKILPFSLLLILVSVFISGCFKDVVTDKYTFYRPVYKTKSEVRASIKSAAPAVLKQPGKLVIRGNFIFLNDYEKGVHVIDYSNPAAPRNVAFIPIPGNVDLAVNGNYLYADMFTDLVTIDITNPNNVSLVKVNQGVFPEKYYTTDSNNVVIDWVRVDTVVKNKEYLFSQKDIFVVGFSSGPLSLASGAPGVPSSGVAKSGSMARFSLMNDRLYAVSHSELRVFSVTNAASPVFSKSVSTGSWDIETIYPFKNNLFIGSQSGMHIYSVANPDNPVRTGQFTHARACDPVVADDHYAYVTLRSGTICQGFTNQMDVIDVTNVSAPSLLKSYSFTNPRGLSKDGDYIFLCDGSDGIKVMDARNPSDIKPITTIPATETYDVIAFNSVAIAVTKEGLYLLDYSNINNVKVVAKIAAQN